jgi:hypothetical protein
MAISYQIHFASYSTCKKNVTIDSINSVEINLHLWPNCLPWFSICASYLEGLVISCFQGAKGRQL